MSEVTGIITAFDSESKMSKAGKRFTVHKMCVGGVWYECGFDKPKGVGAGDNVTFAWEEKYKKPTLIAGSLRGGGNSAPTPPSAPAAAPQSRGGYNAVAKEFPVPVTHPDRSIIRQNALAHASKIVCELRKTPVLEFSDDQGWDEVVERVIAVAYALEEYATGHREVRLSQEAPAQE